MHTQNLLLYSSLLLFVERYAVDSATTTPIPPQFITYTCDTNNNVNNVSITDSIAPHVRVLKKDGEYCQQTSTNKDGILKCIKEFYTSGSGSNKIHTITLIYEDEVEKAIVGGINTKYYTLSCDKKAHNFTAALTPINVKPSLLPDSSTLYIIPEHGPTMKILQPPATIYVGDKLKLEMKADATYTLLPQNCKAYRTEKDPKPYMFWERCSTNDISIIPTQTWTKTSAPTTLNVVMYAFRFIETETLIIKCDTTVCPSSDSDACIKPCSRRKRRSEPETKGKTNSIDATVSLSLQVFDRRQLQGNGGKGLSPVWYMYTIGFGMIYWITWKKV